MIDVYPMTLGGRQVATGVHSVGGNAMGAPSAPEVRSRAASRFIIIHCVHGSSAECAVFAFSGH